MPSKTFTYTGSRQSWTVPNGVYELTIEAEGAAGGAGAAGSANATATDPGGNGGYATASFSVTPGDTFYLYVGGQGGDADSNSGGAGGWPYGADGRYAKDNSWLIYAASGGGGGATDVRYLGDTTSDTVVLAGGGGGGGAAAVDSGTSITSGAGGAGNGSSGEDAGNATGGAGGGASGRNGAQGEAYAESGGEAASAGGSGGGGLNGGGGGQRNSSASGTPSAEAAGGGGGAIYFAPSTTSTSTSSTGSTGDGTVTFSWTEPANAPSSASQTLTGSETSDVTWTPDTSGGPIDHYELEVSEDGGSWTTVDATLTVESYTYTAATEIDTLRFRVRAVNEQGGSDWTYTTTKSTEITSTTTANLTADSVDVSWDSADDATEYDVLLAEVSGSTEADYTVDQTVTSTSATITGLENGEQYYSRPVARYPQADSLGPEISVTTPLPSSALDSLTEEADGDVRAAYTLADNSTDGTVTLERSSDGGASWSDVASTSTLSQTALTDTTSVGGTTYQYRLRRDTNHKTSQSGSLEITTTLARPAKLRIVAINGDEYDLAWDLQSTNEDGVRVYWSRDDGQTWTQGPDLAAGTESWTTPALRDGEKYRFAVEAFTSNYTAVHAPGLREP